MHSLSTLLAAVVLCLTQQPQTQPSAPPEVPGLVKQLSDPDFRIRQDAAEKLRAIGKPALPALQQATKGPDPETRARVALLIRQLDEKPKETPKGPKPPPRLGIQAQINDDGGLDVEDIIPDSRAERIGLQPGDRILKIQDQPANDPADVARILTNTDKPLVIVGERDGKPLTLKETPEDMAAALKPQPRLGIQCQPNDDGGLDVEEIVPDSRAEKIGILPGDRIMKIQDQPVNDPPDVAKILSGTDMPLTVVVQRDEKSLTLTEKSEDLAAAGKPAPKLGIQAQSNDDGGMNIIDIIPDSRAEKIGLHAGDRILKIQDQPVNGPSDIAKILSATTQPLVITGERDDKPLKLEEQPPVMPHKN